MPDALSSPRGKVRAFLWKDKLHQQTRIREKTCNGLFGPNDAADFRRIRYEGWICRAIGKTAPAPDEPLPRKLPRGQMRGLLRCGSPSHPDARRRAPQPWRAARCEPCSSLPSRSAPAPNDAHSNREGRRGWATGIFHTARAAPPSGRSPLPRDETCLAPCVQGNTGSTAWARDGDHSGFPSCQRIQPGAKYKHFVDAGAPGQFLHTHPLPCSPSDILVAA